MTLFTDYAERLQGVLNGADWAPVEALAEELLACWKERRPGLCDIKRVQATLKTLFDCIEKISGRRSRKSLLFCRHVGSTTNAGRRMP